MRKYPLYNIGQCLRLLHANILISLLRGILAYEFPSVLAHEYSSKLTSLYPCVLAWVSTLAGGYPHHQAYLRVHLLACLRIGICIY
jgi:hypothetical protein